MGTIKATLESVESEIYEKRKEVRYDVRDLTVESIVEKYSQSLSEYIDENEVTHGKRIPFNYIYIPDYQRDFTWDPDRQSKLIESIILGLPIPFIFVAENKNSSWEIVDGSQRIRTLHAFVNDNLILHNLKAIHSLNGYTFSELDETRQGKFLNTALRVIVMSEETTDDIKKDMFERINRGSDLLKPMETRKGIFKGKFCDFIYEYCAQNDEFKKLTPIDKWLQNRQEHEELLLRFFALSDTKIYEKGISSGISSFLDEYLKKMNSEWASLTPEDLQKETEKYKNRINQVVTYVKNVFPYGFCHSKRPQTKRAVFESISVGVRLALDTGNMRNELSKNEIAKNLSSDEYTKFTNVANELHKKTKLFGRVNYIYQMLITQEDK